jgi:3-phosphoshikimate 1-carboxyvinyltransferase
VTRFDPVGPLQGELRPPPDKSVSHRAALIGAMAEGPTRITGFLESADTRSSLAAVAAVGAEVREGEPDDHGGLFVEVEGIGLRGARSAEIDVGNAGTLMRIMPGWLAGQPEGDWTLDGDESIHRRPVDRIVEPLGRMGGVVDC